MRVLKWTVLVIVGLVVLLVGYRSLTRDDVNARVAEEVRTNPDGERAARVMLVTLQDGRMYPVNYLWEGDKVFMGIDGLWWREFQGDGQPVKMLIMGATFSGLARVELEDRAYIDDIFTRLRPTVPEWLPDWLNGKLVVIDLTEIE